MGMTLANTRHVIKQNTQRQRLCSDRQQKSNVLAYLTQIRLVVLFVDWTAKKPTWNPMFTKWSKPHPIRLKSDFFGTHPICVCRHNVYVTSHKSVQYSLQLCPNALYNEWANKSAVFAWMCLVISALWWDAVMDVSRGKISQLSILSDSCTQMLYEKVSRHLADTYIITTATDVDVADIDLQGQNKRIRFHRSDRQS